MTMSPTATKTTTKTTKSAATNNQNIQYLDEFGPIRPFLEGISTQPFRSQLIEAHHRALAELNEAVKRLGVIKTLLESQHAEFAAASPEHIHVLRSERSDLEFERTVLKSRIPALARENADAVVRLSEHIWEIAKTEVQLCKGLLAKTDQRMRSAARSLAFNNADAGGQGADLRDQAQAEMPELRKIRQPPRLAVERAEKAQTFVEGYLVRFFTDSTHGVPSETARKEYVSTMLAWAASQ